MDLIEALAPGYPYLETGIRPGEKLHEQMVGIEDAPHTYEYDRYYKILPAIHGWSDDPTRIGDGKKVAADFSYASDNNAEWMSFAELRKWITSNYAGGNS